MALCSLFLQVFTFRPIFNDEVLNVIFGGVIWGASIVIALRGNASTGGTDFIALYISNRTGMSIWTSEKAVKRRLIPLQHRTATGMLSSSMVTCMGI